MKAARKQPEVTRHKKNKTGNMILLNMRVSFSIKTGQLTSSLMQIPFTCLIEVSFAFSPFVFDISHKPKNKYCEHIPKEPQKSPFKFFRLGSLVEVD